MKKTKNLISIFLYILFGIAVLFLDLYPSAQKKVYAEEETIFSELATSDSEKSWRKGIEITNKEAVVHHTEEMIDPHKKQGKVVYKKSETKLTIEGLSIASDDNRKEVGYRSMFAVANGSTIKLNFYSKIDKMASGWYGTYSFNATLYKYKTKNNSGYGGVMEIKDQKSNTVGKFRETKTEEIEIPENDAAYCLKINYKQANAYTKNGLAWGHKDTRYDGSFAKGTIKVYFVKKSLQASVSMQIDKKKLVLRPTTYGNISKEATLSVTNFNDISLQKDANVPLSGYIEDPEGKKNIFSNYGNKGIPTFEKEGLYKIVMFSPLLEDPQYGLVMFSTDSPSIEYSSDSNKKIEGAFYSSTPFGHATIRCNGWLEKVSIYKNGGKIETREIHEDFTSNYIVEDSILNSENGDEYEIHAEGQNGRKSSVKVIFDLTAPTLILSGHCKEEESLKNIDNIAYANSTVEINFKDNIGLYLAKAPFDPSKANSQTISEYSNVVFIDINGNRQEDILLNSTLTLTNEGKYLFRVLDYAGNIKEFSVVIKLPYLENEYKKYGNQYTVSQYYEVNLPPQFKQDAGMHLFKNQEDAKEFAFKKEREHFMLKLGNEFRYFDYNNRSIIKGYPDEDAVNYVIKKWSEAYVSDKRKQISGPYYLKQNDAKYWTKINDEFVENYEDFLAPNDVTPPEGLKNIPIKQLHVNDRVNLLSFEHIGINTNAKMKYVASETGIVSIEEQKEFLLVPNEEFEKLLKYTKEQDSEKIYYSHYKTGFYEITEYDICGNSSSYYVFLDFGKPFLEATVQEGDEIKTYVIDENFIGNYGGSIRFISFKINKILDAVDASFCTLNINGGRINETFLADDAFPQLTKDETGGGRYSISITDRSGNKFLFEIDLPFITPKYTASIKELKDKEQEVVFELVPGERNAFKSVQISKKKSDNSEKLFLEDKDGVKIDSNTLTYTFKEGGIYVITVVDLFGLTTVMPPFTFIYRLPQGVLSIPEYSSTNSKVTFEFNHMSCEVNTYQIIRKTIIEKGKEISTSERLPIATKDTSFDKDNVREKCIYTIFAPKNTDNTLYEICLSNKSDPESFIYYRFYFDTKAPISKVLSEKDKSLGKNISINVPFKIRCAEDERVEYKLNNVTSYYSVGDVLDRSGTYVISVFDRAGNVEIFSIYLDLIVSFDIVGDHTKRPNGTIVSKNIIDIKINEHLSEYTVLATNNEHLTLGDSFIKDGTYDVVMVDLFANKIVLKIIIDTTPPNISCSESLTKEPITIKWETGCVDTSLQKDGLSVNLTIKEPGTTTADEDKHKFVQFIDGKYQFTLFDEGNYEFVAEDEAGNISKISFIIKKSINTNMSIPNNAVVTNTVFFYANEKDLNLTATCDDKNIDFEDSYSHPGKYTITVRDICGNIQTYAFTIIKTKYNKFDLILPDGHSIVRIKKDGNMTTNTFSSFTEQGEYIVVASDGTDEYSLDFIVNNTTPTLSSTRKNGKLLIKNTTTNNVHAKLYKSISKRVKRGGKHNYKLISDDYNFSPITDSGQYLIVLEDEFGNTNQYELKHKRTVSAGGVIGILAGLTVIGIIVGLALKNRYKRAIS